MTKIATNEQLEEGEIVDDDDDLEDISDNSIINSSVGKFVSPYENLRAPYLSSNSDSDRLLKHKRNRKLIRKLKQQKKRKRVRLISDSSDSDVSPPRDLKGKLKEAIRIKDDEGVQKNSLESRLKAVGALPTTPKLSNEQKEKEIPDAELSDKSEDDLENLRLEALKTAILNKCQKRKRKKVEKQNENPPQDNKENTPKVEPITKKAPEVAATINFEEDEDILRASLLAGLAKKIAKKETPAETPLQIKQLPIKTLTVKTALPKRITKFSNKLVNKKVVNNKIQKVIISKPQVKPLIINVNDSDSDDEGKKNNVTQSLPPQKPKPQDITTISNNVEKFLKEQREKFEVENKVREKQVLNKNKNILEKSAVKLLPKSQQIEYQLLLKRLRNAEKQKKAKKMAMEKAKIEPPQKITVNLPQNGESVKVNTESAPKVEIVVTSKSETFNSECSCCGNSSNKPDSLEKRSAIITELTTLQRTLKEIKTQKNGSLQIKGKYQALTPIIRKITATSNERKKQEQRIRALAKELSEARSNLTKSHEQFSKLVRELVSKKEKIELSYEQQRAKLNELHRIKLLKEAKPVTSTPIKPQPIVDETAISTIVSSSTNNECEDMDVCNSDEADCHIDIVDPNDIDQIFKRKPPVKPSIPEYISPLNFNNGIRNVDPHGIMCPYEVNGLCRDIDCTYKHYLKDHE